MFVGYRGWLIRTINGEPTLVSPSHGHIPWAPGENTARCVLCLQSMDENCYCGFYALRNPTDEIVSYQPDIVGQVFLWGKVVEGDLGFRAKKAQVSLLLIPPVKLISEDELIRLSNRYGAPLVKAEGVTYDLISAARSTRLQKSGHLYLITRMKIRQDLDRRRFPRRI